MHISDGVLSPPLWVGGYAVAAGITAVSVRKIKIKDMPRMAVMTSAFFIASLIHIPLGPTSVHLVLNGLVGIVLGPAAFVSVLIGLILQSFLFQHGGITSLGCNAVMIGLPAIAAHFLFRLRKFSTFREREAAFGFIAGSLAVFLGTVILALLMMSTGREFYGVARLAALGHLPDMIVEGIITAFIVGFLQKVKPEMLEV